jgi:tRNA(adenine34) deaminase
MMELALMEARSCLQWDDVPIGAVVARGDDVLARAGNQRERLGDPTAHAEILALRAAADPIGGWRLDGCTVYVTLEPCAMCAGAMVLSRIPRVVFAAADPKAGFAGSLGNLLQDARLNHRIEVTPGVLETQAARILQEFFRARRGRASGPSLDSPRRRAGADERDRLESG